MGDQVIVMPNGDRLSFPDTMTDDQIRDAIKKAYPDSTDTGLRAIGNTARIAGTGAIQGVANIGDAASQALGPPTALNSLEKRLNLTPTVPLAMQPGGTKAALDRMGIPADPKAEASRLGAEYTPLRQGLATATRIGTESALMGAGAVGSALAGTGAAVGKAATGSDWGEFLGAVAAPLAAGRLARSMATKTPTMADLAAEKKALYKASEDAGAIIKDTSYGRAVNEIGDKLEKFPAFGNPKLAPNTTETLKLVEKPVGQHITLEGAESMRRTVDAIIERAAASGEKVDLMMLGKIRDGLNKLIRNAGPGDLLQGDPAAVALLNQARTVAQKYFKGAEIDNVIHLAGTRAAAPDLALRNEFANFARSMDRRSPLDLEGIAARTAKPGQTRWPGYSRAEQEAIEQMVKPSGVRRLIRMMGYAPLFVPMMNEGGKKIAETMVTKQAQRIAEMMRRGTPETLPALSRAARMGAILGGAASVAD